MNRKLFFTILLFLLSIQIIFSQTVPNSTKEKISPELKKEAVAFLRETFSDVANLRTPENRISFNAEMAGLLWFHDEKEARLMFRSVIIDFKQMFSQLDAQLASVKINAGEADLYSIPMLPATNSQAKLIKKFSKAMSVRQQIAAVVSEHDPVLAYSFFVETSLAVTNPELRKQFDNRDNYFEMKLLQAIAEKDPEKGLEAARKSLAKGLNGQHLELLKKLYAKNAEKGAAFGEELVSKLKSQEADKGEGFYYLRSILSAGIENKEILKEKPNQKPMFKEQDLRDIAEMTAQILLKRQDLEGYNIKETADLIKPFLPARAAQIEQKIALERRKKSAAKSSGDDSDESDEVNESPYLAAAKARAEKMERQTKMMEDLKNLGAKKLSDEERLKIIGQAKKMVAEIDDPNMRMMALSGLAAQVGKMGDVETASEIMREAERLVNPQPKNYLNFMQSWLLASGYAEVNPDKSFPILENAIYHLNDTISAFIKVGEFIDVNGDFIEDGEVQIGSFGSEMTNGLLRSLGQTDSTLTNLAKADFTRTKALTNKFDRTEVRILAKMLVLRAIFGSQKTDNLTDGQILIQEN